MSWFQLNAKLGEMIRRVVIGIQSLKYRGKKQSETKSNNSTLFKETVARDIHLNSLSTENVFFS